MFNRSRLNPFRNMTPRHRKPTRLTGRASILEAWFEPLENRVLFAANITSALSDVTVARNAPQTVIDLDPAGTVVRFDTALGKFFVQLYNSAASNSVNNFLSYVNDNDYINSLFHRTDVSAMFEIIQGGSFTITPTANDGFNLGLIPVDPPINMEFNLPNTRGTLAAARNNEVNSATRGFFFNTADNTDAFDANNPYAVFGATVFGNNTVIDAIAAMKTYSFSPPFGQLPLQNYSDADYAANKVVKRSNLALIQDVDVVTGLTYSIIGNTNPGLVTPAILNNQVHLSYTGNTSGQAAITVRMTDSTGAFVDDTFDVFVNGPAAVNDTATTQADTAVVVPVLSNDTVTGGTLVPSSVTPVSGPQFGTISVNPSTGAFTYTPDPGHFGSDSFTYTVTDSNNITSLPATVSLRINRVPTAADDTALTYLNTPVVIPVLANDADADGALSAASIIIVQQPTHGSVSINTDTGAVLYTPFFDYLGQDNFTYRVLDNDGDTSNVASVSLNTQTLVVPVGVGAAKQLTFIDADGTTVTIKVAKATGNVSFDGGNFVVNTTKKGTVVSGNNVRAVAVDITGATSASSLAFAGKGGNGFVDITTITADGDLKSITGKNTILQGGADGVGGINTIGGIKAITLNSANNALIQMGAPIDPSVALSVKLVNATDTAIESLTVVKSIAATNWTRTTGESHVNAPRLAKLSLKGNLDADLQLTGDPAVLATLGALSVKGSLLGGTWNITGDTGNIAAFSILPGWDATVSGDIKGIKTKADAAGNIAARLIKSLSVGGNLTASDIHLTLESDPLNPKLTALGKLAVKGIADGLDLRARGSLGAMSFGATLNSTVFAGITDNTTGLPTTAQQIQSVASIASIKINGVAGAPFGFDNTFLAAANIGVVTIAFPNYDNDGTPFGLAAQTLTSLTYRDANGVIKLATPAEYGNITEGDLAARIL